MATLLAAAELDSAVNNADGQTLLEDRSYKFGGGFKRFAEIVPKNTVKLVILAVASVGVATGLTAEFHRLAGRVSRVSILETVAVAVVCGLAALVLLYVFFDYFPHESSPRAAVEPASL